MRSQLATLPSPAMLPVGKDTFYTLNALLLLDVLAILVM
jgi:hypothetical protein